MFIDNIPSGYHISKGAEGIFTRPKLITEFQADNKIQVSAGKSTNNNPESKTRGENDE